MVQLSKLEPIEVIPQFTEVKKFLIENHLFKHLPKYSYKTFVNKKRPL